MSIAIKPFWRYYGGKYRAALKYPKPLFDTIVEPCAGAAGYSTRHYHKNIILIDKNPTICEIWEFLINSSRDDILSIPLVETLEDLPSDLPLGARYLVGFSFNDATVAPSSRLSAGRKKLANMGRNFEGWNENRRLRIANQVHLIKHWVVVQGDYTVSPDIEATWFIDPPYNNKAGSCYPAKVVDYEHLGLWCRTRKGQVIVCENVGADWMPFQPFAKFKAGISGGGQQLGSEEAVFYSVNGRVCQIPPLDEDKESDLERDNIDLELFS